MLYSFSRPLVGVAVSTLPLISDALHCFADRKPHRKNTVVLMRCQISLTELPIVMHSFVNDFFHHECLFVLNVAQYLDSRNCNPIHLALKFAMHCLTRTSSGKSRVYLSSVVTLCGREHVDEEASFMY